MPEKTATEKATTETPAPLPAQGTLFDAEEAPAPTVRLVGEVMKTYIVAERDGAMLLLSLIHI